MKDKSLAVGRTIPAENDKAIGALLEQVRGLVQSARKTAATAINFLQVHPNFEIGRMIVEHEQHGAHRAEYGKLVVRTLSERLITEFGRGFSKSNLEYMRRFFLEYRNLPEQIAQTPSGQSHISPSKAAPEKQQSIAQKPRAPLRGGKPKDVRRERST